MNKKKPKIREIWHNKDGTVNLSDDGGYRGTNVDYQIKNYKGRSLFNLKFLSIAILLYFIRINEVLTINPVQTQDNTGDLIDFSSDLENKPDSPQYKSELDKQLDRNLAQLALSKIPIKKLGLNAETNSSSDSSTTDTDSDSDSSPKDDKPSPAVEQDNNSGNNQEPLAPEAKKILASHGDRNFVFDENFPTDSNVNENRRPFENKLSKPLENNDKDVSQTNQDDETNSSSDSSTTDTDSDSDVDSTQKEQENLNEQDKEEVKVPEEKNEEEPPVEENKDENKLVEPISEDVKNDVSEVNENQVNNAEPEVVKTQEPKVEKLEEPSKPESQPTNNEPVLFPDINVKENQVPGPQENGGEQNVVSEDVKRPVDQQQNVEPQKQQVLNENVEPVPLEQQNPKPKVEKLEEPSKPESQPTKPQEDVSEQKEVNNAEPEVVKTQEPKVEKLEENVPEQNVVQNQNKTQPSQSESNEFDSEELSAPPQNAFRADVAPNLPQEASFLGGKNKPVTPSDDFDLKQVAKVDVNNLDPNITQQVDNAWLKKQRQSQLIGTQIPVATSYEYNRNAHVLEPKFETPKIMGGIIQTLTDKESKLRRAEKRRLRIQHDLNLYISKESAAVVNMLNNGDMNRLKKMHPLVFMRLQEVFYTQYALDNLMKKDGDKVKRYDKNWYLNSSPTAKESFIEEIRKYSKDPELYGKFKKPKKIKKSREGVYNKLELFHNDYISQRIVRENQYAEKVLRSLDQQSGLYLAPFYHNVVPGLGCLWLMKNFERYFMEAFRSKVTSFGRVAPTLVGRFMLMVENGTILPSTPSSQVAIHALTIMLSHIMDSTRKSRKYLGRKKYYGFMSLCNSDCVDKMFEEKESKNHMALGQIEFLKWVFTFHSEDLLLIDTYAQKIILNNMYAITREDIYRTSPRNIQLRIQSEFSSNKRKKVPSFLELVGNGEDSFLEQKDDELDDVLEEGDGESLLELESGLEGNYEGRSPEEARRLLNQYEEDRKRQYRRMQLEKLLEQQRAEVHRQQEQKESDMFQKAMREREEILRRSQEYYNKPRSRDESREKALFVKENVELSNEDIKKLEKEEEKKRKYMDVYETMKVRLDNLGSDYRIFLKRFMTGYHAPGEEVHASASSDTIVPFHVFVPFNKPSGGYDNQFLDVVQTMTELVNLSYKDFNAYYHSLNTFLLIRTIYSALQSFETSKTRKVFGSRTFGALFRWLNVDSNRYLSQVPKKYLPFTSLSLQLVFFFQELVENYSSKIVKTLSSFFKGIVKIQFGKSVSRPRSFSRLSKNLETYVIYNEGRYLASVSALYEMVKFFKNTFISTPSIPSPVIQYISIFTGLWAQADSETFTLSERGVHRVRKMFLLSFLSNYKSLAEMATAMILKSCRGLRMLHLGCVSKTSSKEGDCDQISVSLEKKKILHIMRVLESTSMDPLDVVRIASDTCRRCVANLAVRPHVGAPVESYLEISQERGSVSGGEDGSDSEDSDAGSEASGTGDKTDAQKGEQKEQENKEKEDKANSSNGKWYDVFTKNPFEKKLTPEEEALVLPHFVDRLMLHSEITHRVHCYVTQKKLVKSMLSALGSVKDEPDVKSAIHDVFDEYRTIEVIQSGMASSIHRLICPYMMDSPDSVRIPNQANIIKYVVDKLASKKTPNIFYTDLFKGLKSKINLLIPSPEEYNHLHNLAGCVLVGSREYNGVYFSGGYAPFSKIDKPTNIMLKPGEGRLVYDGDNFVPELTALHDVSDLETINVVHERDFDRIVYQVRGPNGPMMMTERGFALEYPNFVVRAHVLVTARALLGMGFDMGRIIWCGNKYGWVADFVLKDVVPLSDVPVYNGQYWLLTSELSVKDVVGSVPVRFVNQNVGRARVTQDLSDEDEEHLPNKNVGEINVEITARGKKIGEIKAHGSGVSSEVETPSYEDDDATDLLVGSGGDTMSATPGAVKSVKSAVFNPATHRLTLDLDMPDFVVGQ